MENKAFENLIDEYLKWKYNFNPTFASYLGLSSYDSSFRNFTKEAQYDALEKLGAFKIKTEKMATEGLKKDNKIDRVLLLRDIELLIISLEKIRSWEHNPQIYLDETLDGINTLMLKSFRPIEYTAEMILKKLIKMPQVFKEGKENLKECHPVFLEVSSQTALHGLDFIDMIKKNYGTVIPSLEKDFDKYSKKAKEGLLEFKNFITHDIKPGKENSFAIGKENFSHLIKTDYMIDSSLEEILERGEKCFAAISDKLTGLAAELDPEKSWYEVFKTLKRKNPGPAGVLSMYLDYMRNAKEYLINNDLVTIPPGEILDVEETPAFIRPLIPVAAYISPGPYDDVQKGIFWVTPLEGDLTEEEIERTIGEHNIYTARVTAPHEAYPGHHLQLCLSNLQKSPLRKQLHSNVFVEGWGLYCEEMMKETGYLKGPELELAQQVDQLMRAARVIIDIRLHTMGMTIGEAKAFLSDIVLVSPSTAQVEVNRYTMTPTQPLSYMIGQMEILKLREEYKKLRGNSYKLKDFHDTILTCGSSPIRIIRHIILGTEL